MKNDSEISHTRLRRHRVLTAISKSPNRDHVVSQRDMLVGLWAGTQLGLSGESRATYALEVMAAGLMKSEPGDVVDKVANDFVKNSVPIDRRQILVQLSATHRLVVRLGKAIH